MSDYLLAIIAERLVNKAKCMNIVGLNGNHYAHTFRELTALLKECGISYDINWSKDASKIMALTISGNHYEVATA